MSSKLMRNLYMVPYYIWIILFVIAPIGLILYYSFFDIHGNLSLINYERFFPTAYLLTKTKHKHLWLLLIIVPSWINLLLKAYAFIGIFGAHGAANNFLEFIGVGSRQLLFTDFSFIFVAVYIFIPFMILPIFNALNSMNPGLLDAANDLGASKWMSFVRVIFPLTLDGVKTGCQIVFIPALSLFMITRLIAGNRVITLGTAIEQHFLVTQDWGMGATIAVFLILIMFIIIRLTSFRKRGA